MEIFKKLIEIGANILDKLDGSYVLPIPDYVHSNSYCTSCELEDVTDIKPIVVNNKKPIFDVIIGYSDIKKEFEKALECSSPVSILLVGSPGCGKSEFLMQISKHFPDELLFIDGTYGSKAGIFEKLRDTRPRFVLLDEIDKLRPADQEALLNLMESGRLTKTTKSENYDIELKCWVFATANNKDYILEPLSDRFEIYYLTDYTDDEFRVIAVKRLWHEGIKDEELALYIANSVLRGLGRKSLRDVIRIARKCKTVEQVDETVQTMKRYGKH
jgi:MoxR-like ATPase